MSRPVGIEALAGVRSNFLPCLLFALACSSHATGTRPHESVHDASEPAQETDTGAADAAPIEIDAGHHADDAGNTHDAGMPADPELSALSFVHVKDGRLVDERGRELTLRGVNVKTEALFDVSFTDGRKPTEVVPPWEDWDAPEIAARGFDLVRLCLTWSGLEPEEGKFSAAYLSALDAIVTDLTRQGVYVLLDFHEDAWSKEIGEDGAPLWATLPAPITPLSGPIAGGPGLDGPYDSLDNRRTAKVTLDAFSSFFNNRDQLQDRFLPVWRMLAARYAQRTGVIGFENQNEPVVTQILPDGVSKLYAFHDTTMRALREVNPKHSVWVEPDVLPSNKYSYALPRVLGPVDDNIVWAPHLYPDMPSGTDTYDEFRNELGARFSRMVDAATRWHAAVVFGEYWAKLGDPVANQYVDAIQDLADENHTGIALWNWKGYRNPGAHEGDSEGGVGLIYDWDYIKGKFYLNRPGFEALARPYAIALPGRIDKQVFDRTNNTFEAGFESTGGEGPPLVYIPDHRFPHGFVVELDGVEVQVTRDAHSSRARVPWSGAAGKHTLRMRAASM